MKKEQILLIYLMLALLTPLEKSMATLKAFILGGLKELEPLKPTTQAGELIIG